MDELKGYIEITRICSLSRKWTMKWKDELLRNEVGKESVEERCDTYENDRIRADEMAQWLRALTALPKGLSSNPSNHTVAHNHP